MVAFIKQFQRRTRASPVKRDVVAERHHGVAGTGGGGSGPAPGSCCMMDNPWVGDGCCWRPRPGSTARVSKTSGLTEGAIAAGSFHGTQFRHRFGNNSLGPPCSYNKKLLKAAGVTPPTTWAHL